MLEKALKVAKRNRNINTVCMRPYYCHQDSTGDGSSSVGYCTGDIASSVRVSQTATVPRFSGVLTTVTKIVHIKEPVVWLTEVGRHVELVIELVVRLTKLAQVMEPAVRVTKLAQVMEPVVRVTKLAQVLEPVVWVTAQVIELVVWVTPVERRIVMVMDPVVLSVSQKTEVPLCSGGPYYCHKASTGDRSSRVGDCTGDRASSVGDCTGDRASSVKGQSKDSGTTLQKNATIQSPILTMVFIVAESAPK
jgi:hypothetical protein